MRPRDPRPDPAVGASGRERDVTIVRVPELVQCYCDVCHKDITGDYLGGRMRQYNFPDVDCSLLPKQLEFCEDCAVKVGRAVDGLLWGARP